MIKFVMFRRETRNYIHSVPSNLFPVGIFIYNTLHFYIYFNYYITAVLDY